MTHYEYDAKPNTVVTERGRKHIETILSSEYSVLVGRNNCGKSFLLRLLTQQVGEKASYLGPARYQNFTLLGYFTPNRDRKRDKWRRFQDLWRNQQQNLDNSPLNLQQAIAELSDKERETLSEIVKLLLGTDLEILHTLATNSMSQKYISCGGHNISFTSSGFRLITTLVTSLLDTDYDTFFIDEPELGISPEAQGILADFLFDRAHRAKYFAHIKTLVFATHSTLFLDRRHIGNNYSVTKIGDAIDIIPTTDITDFNNIHFFLLGNRLESLYLPACIIMTEGKTDHAFISRVLEILYPRTQFSIINAGSDGRMKEIVSVAGNLLTDLQKSPYRTRILTILDKVHERDVVETLVKAGIPRENILIWDNNGIEYNYPPEIIDEVFGHGAPLEISDDRVSRNGVTYRKWELCERVIARLKPESQLPGEFREKLLTAIDRVTQ